MTASNSFGLFQHYLFHPLYDPSAFVDPSDLSNLATHAPPPPAPKPKVTDHNPPWPFSSMSVWRLMHWMNTRNSSKSKGKVDRLVRDVINAPDFQVEDFQNLNVHHENCRLDTANKAMPFEDDFKAASVTIEVPTGEPGNQLASRAYSVPGLHYRKLLNVVKAAFQVSGRCDLTFLLLAL